MLVIRNKDDTRSRLSLLVVFAFSSLLLAFTYTTTTHVEGLLPGALDPTFGTGGKVTTDFFGGINNIYGVTVQPDGKILAAGHVFPISGNSVTILARYNADGTLDPTFGVGGAVITPVLAESGLQDVAVQTNGKIVAAGYARDSDGFDYFAAIRYESNGTLDTTFGNGGIVTRSPASRNSVSAVVVANDGRIIIGGRGTPGTVNEVFIVMCLTPNGSLDTTFDNDGITTAAFGTGGDFLYDIVIQPNDGKIVAAGLNNLNPPGDPDFAIARFLPNGSLDPLFSGDGKVTTNIGVGFDAAFEVMIQPDGKIVAAGSGRKDANYNQFEVVRYTPTGGLDTTFSGDGKATVSLSSSNSEAYSAVLQRDGKIVLGGYGWVGSGTGSYMAFARFTSDGQIDTTFDTDGMMTVSFGNSALAWTMATQPDGKIIAGGYTSSTISAPSDFALVRFYGAIPAAADFDGDAKSDCSVFRPSSSEWWYLKSSDNVPGTMQFGLTGDNLIPADYDMDGKTDFAVWRPGSLGYAYILQSRTGTLRFEQFGQTGDLPVVGDWDGDGRPDLAVYRDSAVGPQSYFFYRGSLNNPAGNTTYLPWGTTGDRAMRGDYDGDGRLDAVVFRPSNTTWYILQSSNGVVRFDMWGLATDRFVPADYDGDGKADLAVFRDGIWYIRQSSNGAAIFDAFGLSGDKPAPADYNGDLKPEIAVFRDGTWYILNPDGSIRFVNFGVSTDTPVMRGYFP